MHGVNVFVCAQLLTVYCMHRCIQRTKAIRGTVKDGRDVTDVPSEYTTMLILYISYYILAIAIGVRYIAHSSLTLKPPILGRVVQ